MPGVGCGLGLVTGGAWPGFIAAVRQELEHSERRQKTEDGNPGPGGFHPPHRFRDWSVGRGWELN